MIILAVALVGIVGASVEVYNHFKMWRFKKRGAYSEYAKNYLENPKCDFNPHVNPIVNQNGGGQNLDLHFNFIAHGEGEIVANESKGEIFTYTNSKVVLIQNKRGF